MHDLVPKVEIARGAEECIQPFNKLRRAMGLRALLWDFEKSRQLVLSCWHTGGTDDISSNVVRAEQLPIVNLAHNCPSRQVQGEPIPADRMIQAV